MKTYKLSVDGRTYQVEIENLDANPILVKVDGRAFAVTTERAGQPAIASAEATTAPTPAGPALVAAAAPTAATAMVVPMPGTILEVKVRPGDTVKYGDEIAVLEAMKMKSFLRAERDGTIAEVRVTPGQSVAHGDILIIFA